MGDGSPDLPAYDPLPESEEEGGLYSSGPGTGSRWQIFTSKPESNFVWAHTGVTLSVNHVNYSVSIPKKGRKALLRDVSVMVEPGEMTYIMGPSGAGKSTLLEVMSGRVKSGFLSGAVLFNGEPRGTAFWRESSYVKQDDIHIPILTVRETLRFAAKLRMGSEYTDMEREERVAAVADLLGLHVCLDSICGDSSLRGISGGQLKRLSIGVEIMNMPSLIFLDEPTSGLDSVISQEVMSFVSKIAQENRTVIATIHQPAPETFALSRRVVLLAQGRVCYCGPTSEVVNYFQSPGLGFSNESFANPADFALSVVSGAQVPLSGTRPLRPVELASVFKKSAWCQATEPLDKLPSKTQPADGPSGFPTSIFNQMKVLLERGWMVQVRQKRFIAAQIGKNAVVAMLCGAIFYGQGAVPVATNKYNSETFNVASILYFAMMYTIVSNLQIIPQLFAMKVLYTRERAASVYSTVAYWFAGAIINLPLVIICHLVFYNISYFLVKLDTAPSIYIYSLIVTLLNNLVAFYFAQFLAAKASSAQVALAIFPVTFLFLTSFAGFTVPLDHLPTGWAWASYISYPRWCYEGLVAKQFSKRKDDVAALSTFFGVDSYDWNTSLPILGAYIVLMNLLVLYGLLPERSRVRYEDAAGDEMADEPCELSSQHGEESKFETTTAMELGMSAVEQKERLLVLSGEQEEEEKSGEAPVEDGLSLFLWSTLGADVSQRSRLPDDEGLAPRTPSLDVKDFEVRSVGVKQSRGIRLMFHNLEYSISCGPKRAKKQILHGVSGRVVPGEMCAIMGGSGAGKSTLLDLLAGRKTSGFISGDIYFNGRRRPPSAKHCSYVTQDNVHIGSFTVRETLRFAALLRVKESMTMTEREKRVDEVLSMLGLEEVSHVIVGDALRKGISGGQARRLTIGVEIINLPDLIFLDEPTSGLDSTISYEVMASVRNLANQNRTVICTIHQPSHEVFALFDKLILMAMGQQVFYGYTHEAVKYFSSPSLDYEYTKGRNPAEFVMDACSGVAVTREGTMRGVAELVHLYASSDLCLTLSATIDEQVAMDGSGERETVGDYRLFPRNMYPLTKILNQRNLKKLQRYRRPVVVAFIRHIVVALFYGSLYWNVSGTAIQSRLSLLFFAIMFVMLGQQQVVPSVFEERLLYYREKGAHVYGAWSYWMTCATCYVPQNVLNTLVYSAVVYPMAGLHRGTGPFFYFYLIVMLSSLCSLYFCQLLAVCLPNAQTAVAMFPAALFLFIAFAGFIVRIPSLNPWLGSWAPYVSFARWSFQGLVINEFQGNPVIDYARLPSAYTPNPYQSFITSLGFEQYSKWYSVPILLLNMVVFRVATYAALKYINHERR